MIKTILLSFQHFMLILLLLSGCSGISPGINPNSDFKTLPGDQKIPISLYFDKPGKYTVSTFEYVLQEDGWRKYSENTWITIKPIILEYEYSELNDRTGYTQKNYYQEFCYDNTKKSIINYFGYNNTIKICKETMPLYLMIRSKEKPREAFISYSQNFYNLSVNTFPKYRHLRYKDIKINRKMLHEFKPKVKCRHCVDLIGKRNYLIIDMIHNDAFIPVGIKFCNSNNLPIRGKILSNEWKKRKSEDTWYAELKIEHYQYKREDILLYKTEDCFTGSVRYQFDLCKPQNEAFYDSSLIVNIPSKTRPGDLNFDIKRIRKNIKNVFVPFREIETHYFMLNGKHPNVIYSKTSNREVSIELQFKKQEIQAHKKQKANNVSTKTRNPGLLNKQPRVADSIKVMENFKIGVLPFSKIISDELKSIIQPETLVNKIRIKVIRTLQNRIKGNIKSVNYPNNTAPFTQETIDLIAPTLKKDIKNTPLYILGKICQDCYQDKIIMGHFEENLINNQLVICLRLYDCKTQEMIPFSQHIDLDSQQTISEKDIDMMINKIVYRLRNVLQGLTI